MSVDKNSQKSIYQAFLAYSVQELTEMVTNFLSKYEWKEKTIGNISVSCRSTTLDVVATYVTGVVYID